jgi:copper(I)-binding protein
MIAGMLPAAAQSPGWTIPTSSLDDVAMKALLSRRRALLVAAALACSLQAAAAEKFTVGSIEIDNPWTRATPKGSTVAGAYLTIVNKGTSPDRLVGGSMEGAAQFQVHQMIEEGGVARMRPVEGGLEIKPGDTVELKPSGYHVMVMGLQKPLGQGQHVKGTLVFQKAGKVDVEFAVLPIGAPGGDHSTTMPGY